MCRILTDSLGLTGIKSALNEVLENAGFTALEEYTDIVLADIEGCSAVWALEDIKLTDAGRRIDSGDAAVLGEIGFRVKLMGKTGMFGDHITFDDRCSEACAGAAMIRNYGSVSVTLGAVKNDTQIWRLVREMRVVFGVSMKQTHEGSAV